MHTLEAKHLRKTFTISEAQRRAQDLPTRIKVGVDDISFTAKSGEVFGLLGPNGAGKTTTMRMLATLLKPDKGDDAGAAALAHDIVKKIEEELEYPGQIKATVIRETRVVDYAK